MNKKQFKEYQIKMDKKRQKVALIEHCLLDFVNVNKQFPSQTCSNIQRFAETIYNLLDRNKESNENS